VELRRLIRLLILRTLADFSGRTQPQRDEGGLHRFPHHAASVKSERLRAVSVPYSTSQFRYL